MSKTFSNVLEVSPIFWIVLLFIVHKTEGVGYKHLDSSGTHCKTEQSAATTIIAYVLFNVVDTSCQLSGTTYGGKNSSSFAYRLHNMKPFFASIAFDLVFEVFSSRWQIQNNNC